MISDEHLDFLLLMKVRAGMSFAQAVDWVSDIISSSNQLSVAAKNAWREYKATLKSVGTYVPAVLDAATLTVLASEMKKGRRYFS